MDGQDQIEIVDWWSSLSWKQKQAIYKKCKKELI